MPDADCVFCKIIAGDIPANVVYEDDSAIAIMDIEPIEVGHCVLIAKDHAEEVYDLDEETYSRVLLASRKVAEKQREIYEPLRVITMIAGLDVPHAHVNIFPVYERGYIGFPKAKGVTPEGLKSEAAKLRIN